MEATVSETRNERTAARMAGKNSVRMSMGVLRGRSHVPVTAEDYQLLAHRRLPRFLRDYIDGGAGGEDSMAANEDDFQLLSPPATGHA